LELCLDGRPQLAQPAGHLAIPILVAHANQLEIPTQQQTLLLLCADP